MENEICSICQDDISGISNILTTKCNHKFHTDCYMKYIKSSHKNCCPICRQNILDDSIQSLDDEYHDFVIRQQTTLISSLRSENYRLLYENTSLLEKMNMKMQSYEKEMNEIKSYDKKKYLLFKKK